MLFNARLIFLLVFLAFAGLKHIDELMILNNGYFLKIVCKCDNRILKLLCLI